MMRFAFPLAVLALLLGGCTVGPKYRRPAVSAPDVYHNAPANTAGAASLADQKWWDLLKDPELQNLIRTALSNNYDVQIAATRILEAQAQVGIVRSQEYPSVGSSAGFTRQGLSAFAFSYFQIQALLSWDPDFWGKYRRATEAARATLVATEWQREDVIRTLVASIAIAYFQLRELDRELEISNQTLASRRESLALTQTLANGGAAPLLDVRQAEQLVETAAATIASIQRQIGIQEDLISTLTGSNPHTITRGQPLEAQPAPPDIPAGLPSSLLERRPDIRFAEQQLAAATANIGVARAAFFPSLPLTGGGGITSTHLGGLFTGPNGIWSFGAPLSQPIFTAGRLRSNLELTEAQQQQALLQYRQAIQNAFRQVSDALIGYQKDREFRQHQEALTAAAQDAARLSDLRYRGGATSYLEVLTSQTNYFTAQLGLERSLLSERLSLVQLYAALGGGWEQ